ncbi:MAG: hypothetical protein P1U36_03765 [Legionellaceae bacterium]|nr:hypothetical protein [Legionellaceae bacterium]
MSDIDEQINALRERLGNLGAQQESKAKTKGLFSNGSKPDVMRSLQGDITRLLTQAKLQAGFELTSKQLAALKELRAEVRDKVAEVSPSTVKHHWTEVRQQAESSKSVSAQSVFKQWAQEKREVDEDNKNKPEGPGLLGINKGTNK